MKCLCLVLLIPTVLSAPAGATDRTYGVTGFDRVRIEGPFVVRLVTRGTPAARASGSAIDGIDLRVEGTTLIVRADPQAWKARAAGDVYAAPTLDLRTTDLNAVSVNGGAKLEIVGPVRSARVDLQVSGSGSITAPGIDTEQLNVALIGAGALTLGGRAAQARVVSSGDGTIEATALQTDTLVLRLDGSGATRASARYFATVVSSGLGSVTVYGKAKCTVKAAGGPVDCGVAPPM